MRERRRSGLPIHHHTRARLALGEPRYHAEWSAGATLAPDALLAEALAQASGARRHPALEERTKRGGG